MKILQRKTLFHRMGVVCDEAIVLMCAPMGYGKTTAVREYLIKNKMDAVWFSMEGEPDEDWIWSKLQKEIFSEAKQEHPVFYFPIPKNREENEEWLQRVEEKRRTPLHIILDDFEWEEYSRLEEWIAFCSNDGKGIVCLWVLSRENPKGKMMELTIRQKAQILNTLDFTFGAEDVRLLFLKENICLTDENVKFILQYTNGWIAAIQLVLSIYKDKGNFYNLSALDSLMEAAFYSKVDNKMKTSLIMLSILKNFTLEQAEYLCGQKEIQSFLIWMVKKNSFAYKVSQEKYCIAPVLNEMLKRELLHSDLDIKELHDRAGDWFFEKKEHLEAIREYMFCGNYEKMILVLQQCEDRSLMDTAPELIIKVFRQMPEYFCNEYPYVYMKWILDMITNVDVKEGKYLLTQFCKKIQTGKIRGNAKRLLGEYYFALAFTQFNNARKMHDMFMLAFQSLLEGGGGVEISRLAYHQMVDTFGSNHLLYLYHNQAGELRDLVGDIDKKAKYFIRISNGVNTGMESQSAAEYAFETGDYKHVEELAVKSFSQADGAGRSSISICSLFLRGRLGALQNKRDLFDEMLELLKGRAKQAENPIIRCEADCAIGYLYGITNQNEKIPQWIKGGKIEKSAILPEASMVFYIAAGISLLLSKKYKSLLAVSSLMEQAFQKRMHVFGLIYAFIFKVIGYYRLYGLEKASECTHELLKLCEKDHIVTPLIEFRNPLNEIMEGIILQDKFLKEIMRLFHRYGIEEVNQNKEINRIQLTKKEGEVMQYLVQGKKVSEIADFMRISQNTVQTHMKSIYRKYDVNSKIDVIRAYEKVKNKEIV